MSKGDYIQVDPEELEAVSIESKRMIEIDELCGIEAPPTSAATSGLRVDASSKKVMVALGSVVFTSREHVIALEARGKGIMGVTLRYPYEVRDEKDFFDDIPSEKVTKDMLDLASHIVKTKTGHFNPKKFEDATKTLSRSCCARRKRARKLKPRANGNQAK